MQELKRLKCPFCQSEELEIIERASQFGQRKKIYWELGFIALIPIVSSFFLPEKWNIVSLIIGLVYTFGYMLHIVIRGNHNKKFDGEQESLFIVCRNCSTRYYDVGNAAYVKDMENNEFIRYDINEDKTIK